MSHLRRACLHGLVAFAMAVAPSGTSVPLLTAETAWAAVPQLINYQGRLTDTAGAPVTGEVTITFRLYDDASTGAKQWEEQQAVSLNVADNGVFSVVLGSVTPLSSVSFNVPLWLSIQVADDEEMSPRQRLTASGYAMNADALDSLDSASFLRADVDTSASGTLTITRSGLSLLIKPTTDPDRKSVV